MDKKEEVYSYIDYINYLLTFNESHFNELNLHCKEGFTSQFLDRGYLQYLLFQCHSLIDEFNPDNVNLVEYIESEGIDFHTYQSLKIPQEFDEERINTNITALKNIFTNLFENKVLHNFFDSYAKYSRGKKIKKILE